MPLKFIWNNIPERPTSPLTGNLLFSEEEAASKRRDQGDAFLFRPPKEKAMGRGGRRYQERAGRKKGMSESRMTRNLDKLAEYELFDEKIGFLLQKMVLENWSPAKIRAHFAPLIQATMIKRGIQGDRNALKDILDRHEGTAVQRVEERRTYEKMSKREMAAVALQKLKDSGVIDVTTGKPTKDVDNESE